MALTMRATQEAAFGTVLRSGTAPLASQVILAVNEHPDEFQRLVTSSWIKTVATDRSGKFTDVRPVPDKTLVASIVKLNVVRLEDAQTGLARFVADENTRLALAASMFCKDTGFMTGIVRA
jgi:hypothetical protein